MEKNKKRNIYLVLFVVVILLIIGGIIFTLSFTADNLTSNTSGQKLNTSVVNKLVYYTREVSSLQESGEQQYQMAVYTINVDGFDQKKIYNSNDAINAEVFGNDYIVLTNDPFDLKKATVINKSGEAVTTIDLPDQSWDFVLAGDGKNYAYSTLKQEAMNEKVLIELNVVQSGQSTKQYIGRDFFVQADDNFSQVTPLGFSPDGMILYVEVWPSKRGGDIVDPHGIFGLSLQTGIIEEIILSGSRDLDYVFSENNFYVSALNLWPESNQAIILGGYGFNKGIYNVDLGTKNKELLVDVDDIDGEASLPLQQSPISPDEQYLVLDRGVSVHQSIDIYDYGFHLFNLEKKELVRDFYTSGNFAGWVDNTHIAFYDFRHQSWDDKYYTLKIVDITTKNVTEIYTQRTDHPEGADLSQIGDKYYEFLGVIK